MGWVVVDADRHPGKPDGVAALAELGELPPHPVVKTAGGGEHHFFRQPALPVADNHALAGNGIDVLGTSRFVVGYDLGATLAVEMPELPEVFRPKVGGGQLTGNLNTVLSSHRRTVVSSHRCRDGLTEALMKLDPRAWNGEFKDWLALMTACRFVGIDREDFIGWSTGDPDYANDGDEIARLWEHTKPIHGGALFKALSAAGIKHRAKGQPGIEAPCALPASSPLPATSASAPGAYVIGSTAIRVRTTYSGLGVFSRRLLPKGD
jgi:hypothetical protein